MPRLFKNIYRNLQPLLCCGITGIISGGVIALFLACARVVLSFAFGLYSAEHTPLAVVCIIMLILLCCIGMAVIQTLCPLSKGSGIPLAEASARGMLRVKWLKNIASIIVGSMLAFLCGMPLGSEGPSIGVGGLIGEGIGRISKKPEAFRRYLITGGASAGLATAFNAPLTGVVFALEETHRRFSPTILLAAFSAVIPAVVTSQLVFWGLGQDAYLHSLGLHAGFTVLPQLKQTEYATVLLMLKIGGIAAVCAAVCAAAATAFNYAIFALDKLFKKIELPVLRLLPPFALTAICGLIIGHSVGSGETTFAEVSVNTASWLLVVLLLMRFAMTVTASGSGATGGLFLPMIAIGGLIGTISSKIAIACGMDAAFAPNLTMLCISAFFAASARAPISAIVLALELTSSFANILPLAVAVGIATALGGALRAEPLYERMMEQTAKANIGKGCDITVTGAIPQNSLISGRRIRDILWPYNTLVTDLVRGDVEIVPDGETVLRAGDKLTIRAENVSPEHFEEAISGYIVRNLQ